MSPPAPKPPEEIDLAETRFFGVRAWPRGPRSPCHLQKITCKEVSGPWKFRANPSNGSQVTTLFWSDTRTDRPTQGQKRITSVPLQNFFLHVCEWEGGKLYKTYQISTSSLCEGLQFVMHDFELDSNFLTRYSLLNFAYVVLLYFQSHVKQKQSRQGAKA